MKKFFILVFALIISLGFISCGGDDKDEPTPTPEPEKEVSVVGVWEDGDYFVSFNSSGYYCAYLPDAFIDDGAYAYNSGNKIITCTNLYFNREETKFSIQSIIDNKITANVTYVNVYGQNKTKSLTLTKTTKQPTDLTHKLVGRSITYMADVFGNITLAFLVSNAGTQSCTKGTASKYPLHFYYIFKSCDNKLYFHYVRDQEQIPTIGGWGDYELLHCWELIFNTNGSINHNNIFSKRLTGN